MNSWFIAILESGKDYDWVCKNPELAIGTLAYAVASKTHLSAVEIKSKVRKMFTHAFDYAYEYLTHGDSSKSSQKIEENIIALNNLFILVDQIRNEGGFIYYTPLVCEFIVSSFAQEREKAVLAKRLAPMLFTECPDEVFIGIFKTFALMESKNEAIPDVLPDVLQKTKKETLQKILKFQNAHPTQLKFLHKIGIVKNFHPKVVSVPSKPPIFEMSHVSTELSKKSADSEEAGLHMKIKESLQIKIFASTVEEAFNKKILNTLEKEKEIEIGKVLLYYERLSISTYKTANTIPVEIIQYALVWSKNRNDLKKAAHPYIERRVPSTPKFVPVVAAWCMIYEQNALHADFSSFDKEAGEILLKSCCFFLSIYEKKDKEEKWEETAEMFKIFIKPSNFPGLARIHAKHPWTLRNPAITSAYMHSRLNRSEYSHEILKFYASKLMQYKFIETVTECNLEYEAYCELEQRADKEPANSTENLKNYIKQSAARKKIDLHRNSEQKQFKIEIENVLRYVHATIKKYGEESAQLKEIVKILLADGPKECPSPMLKDIFEKAPKKKQIQIFLKILYIFTILETDLLSLAGISQTLSPNAEFEKEEP
ncbi:hypothetical protein NEMIN01_0733 [Nematocida minor]|uniref:uncharacterized protein n=1 Tax=Nematocida minor TaxID=1912983 RepID=UPI0022204B31|nr:uncharacterized protein NEMIN01_0733 [Nematocida minor]KAI5189870.1 hypothetical protein NEMIN01_0733 [Nematocida minor]